MKVESSETEKFEKYWERKLFWSKILFVVFFVLFIFIFLIPVSERLIVSVTAHLSGLSLISAVALYLRGIYEKGVEAAIDFMY